MSIATIWALAGLILIIADVIFGTFFMLFLGVGAIITAAACWIGLGTENTAVQWLIFSAASTLGVGLFRKKLVKMFGSNAADKYQEHAGNVVVITAEIPANDTGRAKYRGAEWPARTVSGEAMAVGTRAKIVTTDGIVLNVSPE